MQIVLLLLVNLTYNYINITITYKLLRKTLQPTLILITHDNLNKNIMIKEVWSGLTFNDLMEKFGKNHV